MTQVYFIKAISEKPLIPCPIDGENLTDDMEEIFVGYDILTHDDEFAFFGDAGVLFRGRTINNTILLRWDKKEDLALSSVKHVVTEMVKDMNKYYDEIGHPHHYAVKFADLGNCMSIDFYWTMDKDDFTTNELKKAKYL